MKTIVISIASSLGIVGIIVAGGMALSKGNGASSPSPELAILRQDLSGLREEIQGLAGEVRSLRASQQTLARSLTAARSDSPEAPAAGEEDPAPAALALDPAGLTESVALVIAEERRIQEAERQRQREEMRQRMDERRQELEAMRQGPYDRYNLKVNSLAKSLNLSEGQKQAYFELMAAHRTKLDEGMKLLRDARAAENAAAGGESGEGQRKGRGPGGGFDREKYRELSDTLQKSFAAGMQAILTPEQHTAYGGLSRSSQSYLDLDMVSASSGGDNRSEGTRGFSPGGFGGGGPGGRGGFGGGGPGGGGRGR